MALLILGLALALAIGHAGVARATYAGANGAIAWENFSAQDDGAGPSTAAASDVLETDATTIAGCNNRSGPLACDFGRPSYSRGGGMLVVSRLVPSSSLNGTGSQGALMLVGANGSGSRLLARQTSDDEDPAFLPAGNEIVFDGRTSASASVNLYTVTTAGTGRRQLTHRGGSEPAPCGNGSIAYISGHELYLLSGSRRSERRLTFRGAAGLSCSPDSRTIAFVRHCDLYTIGADGKHAHRLASPQKTQADSDGCAYDAAYSPDGREVAFLARYNAPSQNGTQVALEVVDLHGRSAAPLIVAASSSFSGDSGSEATGSSAGLSWQRAPAPVASLTAVKGSPVSSGLGVGVDSIAFGPGSRLLATASGDGSVSTFLIHSSGGVVRSISRTRFRLPHVDAKSITFSPSGRFLAAADAGGGLSVFAVNQVTGALAAAAGSPFSTGGAGATGPSIAFSPSGGLLAVTEGNGGVWLLSVNAATGALTSVPGSPFSAGSGTSALSAAFSPGGSRLAVAGTGMSGGVIALFSVNATTGSLAPVPGSPFATRFGPYSVSYTARGRLLAAASELGGSPYGTAVLSMASPTGPPTLAPGSPFFPLGLGVFGVAHGATFSPSGDLTAAVSEQPIAGSASELDEISLASLDPSAVAAPGWSLPVSPGRGAHADTVAFNESRTLLASGNTPGSVSLFATPAPVGP